MLLRPRRRSTSRSHAAVGLAFSLLSAVPVAAQASPELEKGVRTDRRFTYLDETLHGAQVGEFEMENWVTWERGIRGDSGLDNFAFKHEVEFGLSKDLVAAVDLVEWHTTDASGDWVTKYDGMGAELRFRLADPREGIGAAYKTELGFGPRELEWENELILDRWLGRWVVAYNLRVEAALEGEKSFEYEES
jgi:hypothetical protein